MRNHAQGACAPKLGGIRPMAANDPAPVFALFVTNERKAAAELSEAGFEAWAPTYQRLIEARDRASLRRQNRGGVAMGKPALVSSPLFPGYVFVRIADDQFARAKACEHVAYVVVSSDGRPREVPQQAFADMLVLVMSGRMDERLPGTKARPRGVRRQGLVALNEWFAIAGRSMKRAA